MSLGRDIVRGAITTEKPVNIWVIIPCHISFMDVVAIFHLIAIRLLLKFPEYFSRIII